MAQIYEDECRAAGFDPAVVRRIARRIERAALDAQAAGIQIFGGSSGTLRPKDEALSASSGHGLYTGRLILADIDGGSWDGGDGGYGPDDQGLQRGE